MSGRTYTEEEVTSYATPNFTIDLAGAARTPMPFKTLQSMWYITGVVGDIYLGKRTKPYRMKWNVYCWLAKCSAHNRQLPTSLGIGG